MSQECSGESIAIRSPVTIDSVNVITKIQCSRIVPKSVFRTRSFGRGIFDFR